MSLPHEVRMKVIAAAGLKVPMEHDPARYITEHEPVEIDASHYYVRRLADGDLVEAPGDAAALPAPRKPAAKA